MLGAISKLRRLVKTTAVEKKVCAVVICKVTDQRNEALKTIDSEDDITRSWESIRSNVKFSANKEPRIRIWK